MRALVIDDSRPVRGIIAKMMKTLHFDTWEVTNGKEALDSLRRDCDFDVVTVNWQMPIMDGLEFVRQVRADPHLKHLPLLMISSESDARQVELALETGVSDYIVKPCTPRSIEAKLTAMGVISAARSAPPDEPPQSITGSSFPATLTPIRGDRDRSKIGVLVIDDSAVVRSVVSTLLNKTESTEVIGTAADGTIGLEMIQRLQPDAILLDVDMPRMDGLETLRRLRELKISVPVLMFSSRTQRGAKTATEALLLGAKDFVFKPGGGDMSDIQAGSDVIVQEVIPRLQQLIRRRSAWTNPGGALAATTGEPTTALCSPIRPLASLHPRHRVDLVVIAASTGGPAALATLVSDPALARALHAPILIAQHMPKMFTQHLASRLASDSGLDISEAVHDEVLMPGMIRIAPGGRHLAVRTRGEDLLAVIHDEPPVHSCRPAADVLFQSAAPRMKQHLLAVVLTGMGQDGLEGSREVRDCGGRVIAQDEASSVVWGMPGSVVKASIADRVVPLKSIAAELTRHLRFGRSP